MKSVILPIAKPIIKCYAMYANTFSILCNDDRTLPWTFDNYINLIFINESKSGTVLESAHDNIAFCPFLGMQIIDSELVNKSWKSVTEFLVDNVDFYKYTQLYVDEYFIPCCSGYQREGRRKFFAMMIYGYNLNESCFYTLSYYEKNQYKSNKILFSDLEKAYLSSNKYNSEYGFLTFKFKANVSYLCEDGKQIKNFLIDYLECKDSSGRYFYKRHLPVVKSFTYGISYYDHIIENNGKNVLTSLYILYDHKVLMEHRLLFLKERGWILNFEKLNNMCVEIKQLADFGVKLGVKHMLSPKDTTFRTMDEVYKKMKELDYRFTNELINSIIIN